MYKGSVAFSAGSHAITPEARAKPLKLINDAGASKNGNFWSSCRAVAEYNAQVAIGLLYYYTK